MKALNPQRSASLVCGTVEVSLLKSIELLNIPSPGTLLPFHDARFNMLPSDHRRRRRTALRNLPPPGVGSRLGRVVRSGVRALLARSPTGLAESLCSPGTGHLCYGLFIRLRLLSTLSVENAVTFDYGVVTNSPIGTFTQLFNRLHRRTSGGCQPTELHAFDSEGLRRSARRVCGERRTSVP